MPEALTSVNDAKATILAACAPLPAEDTDLRDVAMSGVERVLALRLVSARALPPRDNSAMDGYAVGALDEDVRLPLTLPLTDASRPGHPRTTPVAPMTACAITTGGTVPPGTFAVVMREQCDEAQATATAPTVTLAHLPRAGEHVRRRGEDIDVGGGVGDVGSVLTPARLNLLWSAGVVRAPVVRRPRVGIMASGDELREVGSPLSDDVIVNSNAWAVAAACRRLGCDVSLLGIAKDSLDDHVRVIKSGLGHDDNNGVDVLLTIGGVSVGSHDFVRPALEAVGARLSLWRIAMRPGKPLAFGALPNGALVFGLPGNPVSAMVTFRLFVQPALRRLFGHAADDDAGEAAVLGDDVSFHKKRGLAFFARATHRRDGERLVVTTLDRQGSGQVSGLADATCLCCFAAADETIAPGAAVRVLWL